MELLSVILVQTIA